MTLKKRDLLVKNVPAITINGEKACPYCKIKLKRLPGWQSLAKKADYEYSMYYCPKCEYSTSFG